MNEENISTAVEIPKRPGFLVVGVGASAGGLVAFQRLLEHIPRSTQLALVLVQHLARDQESLLAVLLDARTPLTVRQGIDGERIIPGHAYVIEPNTHMSVIDGHLRVQPRPPGRARDVPIDQLFASMADAYGEKAIGVVLSGGGSDGSFGVQQIHGAGGITFAQTPEEAQVDSMPRSAIATGVVSVVAGAREISEQLVRLAEHPFYRQADGGPETDTPHHSEVDLQNILRVLRRATGVDFTRYKTPTLRRRIQRRMAIHHTNTFAEYLGCLTHHPGEAKQLHDDILIHVTSFFRDPESFEALKQSVLPKLIHLNRSDGPIRVWVPGCSSGEEAYSLAITILDVISEHRKNVQVTLFGTDLSQRMIERARAGVYPDSITAEVPEELLKRYFVKVSGGYRVSPEVRERCVFARQDITRDPPFSKLDLVMCRNLLIYLSQPAQRKVTEIFHYALLPRGILTLGRSETIGPMPELFSVIDSRWKIYQRNETTLPPAPIDFGGQSPAPFAPTTKFTPRLFVRERRDRDFSAETNRLLIERYAPPLVIVDDALRVVRTQGVTSPYLELPTGDVSLDVLRLIRPGLLSVVRTLLQDARTSGTIVRKEGVVVRTDAAQRLINLEVTRIGSAENYHYVMAFEDAPQHLEQTSPSNVVVSEGESSAVEHLRGELSDMRAELESLIQELESANEELQSANEEILSSNEELQSTNEELDTAREELQSTNEELGTVNEELQARNEELSRVNSDLINLLDSVDLPIVMVTSELKIRRFTRAAERALNLIPSDVGRPIGHIKPNIGFNDLESVLRDVIERCTIREREVQDCEGRTYLAAIRPYRDLSNRVDGAVLVLFDVSESLRVARDMGEALMSTVHDPILLLDSNFVVQRANQAFYETFSLAVPDSEGRSLFELGESRWDIPELRQLLEELLHPGSSFKTFVAQRDVAGFGSKKTFIDGTRIGSGRPGSSVLLLAIREEPDK